MSGFCLGIAFSVIEAVIPADALTLAWTHSVEKTRWEEDYRLVAGGLELAAARIQGSGAGMEPPDDARRRDGFWHYRPRLPLLEKLALARILPQASDRAVIELFPCPAGDPAAR